MILITLALGSMYSTNTIISLGNLTKGCSAVGCRSCGRRKRTDQQDHGRKKKTVTWVKAEGKAEKTDEENIRETAVIEYIKKINPE